MMRFVSGVLCLMVVLASVAAEESPPSVALYGSGDSMEGVVPVAEVTVSDAKPAMEDFSRRVELSTAIRVPILETPLEKLAGSPAPVALLVGEGRTILSQPEALSLKTYLDKGGVVLVLWQDDQFQNRIVQWIRSVFPANPLRDYPPGHPLTANDALPLSFKGATFGSLSPRLLMVDDVAKMVLIRRGDATETQRFVAALIVGAALNSPNVRRDAAARLTVSAVREGEDVVFALDVGTFESPLELEIAVTDIHGKIVARSAGKPNSLLSSDKPAIYTARFPLAKRPFNPQQFWVTATRKGDPPVVRKMNLGDLMGSLETSLMGQKTWIAGSAGSVRLIARDSRDAAPIAGATVRAELRNGDKTVGAFDGKTDAAGTVDLRISVPGDLTAEAQLYVEVGSALGDDSITETIQIQDARKVLLTTDKPIYQPGQTIHLRALTLRQGNLKPVGKEPMTFEIEDSKGNKVFKFTTERDDFGISSAEFTLADELNMGTYTVRAVDGVTVQEKTVTVEKYVLPKFKVVPSFEKEEYAPGETVKGSVQTDYFFGKPVAGAKVEIAASKFDVGFETFARLTGRTDETGRYEFEFPLEHYFAGLPLEQGGSFVQLEFTVTDTAEHTEKATATRPVVASPMTLVVLAESGNLVGGVENEVYVVVATPQGAPIEANVTLTAGKTTLTQKSDALGVATFRFTPESGDVEIAVRAEDSQGRTADKKIVLNSEGGGILLRPEKALAKAGEVLRADILSTRKEGPVYVDVIRNRQTILTKSAYLTNHRAEVSLPLDVNDFGTLELHAYQLGSGEILRNTRRIYVSQADDLTIDIRPNQEVYRPGEDASLEIRVTDSKGGVLAALGIQVVDESVFARQEMQPGLEKVFFTLEAELLKPRYEVHGFEPEIIVQPPYPMPRPLPDVRTTNVSPLSWAERKQQAAKILFAAAEVIQPEYTLAVNTRETKTAALQESLAKQLEPTIKKLLDAMEKYFNKGKGWQSDLLDTLVREKFLSEKDLLDPWGGRIHMVEGFDTLVSLGPDGRLGTSDDVPLGESVMAAVDERNDGRLLGRVFWGAPGRGGAVRFKNGEIMEQREMMAMDAVALAAAAPEMASTTGQAGGGEVAPARIREFFPETLLVVPSLITDANGNARLKVPLADSITTWRLSAMASSMNGLLGSTTAGIRVFQDFFLDADLPLSLTVGDEVSVPIALYNYLETSQPIRLELEKADWFDLLGEPEIRTSLDAGEVTVRYFRIRAKSPGNFPFTVKGFGTKMSDAVRRRIDVVPDGQEIRTTVNDRLSGKVEKTVAIPLNAVPGVSKLWVKLYPGVFSQVVEGLDSILQMPFGCFEQTSSATYPNILALSYMKATKQNTPEVQMKAQQYISLGYQRLLSFEVKGGGYEWFGNEPANQILTAYGLMEFFDMSQVHEVDPNVLARAAQWLLGKQKANGAWEPDKAYLHDESWGRIQANELLPTAYILWALNEAQTNDPRVGKGIAYLKANWEKAGDPYMLALIANALVTANRNDTETNRVMERLASLAVEEKDAAYWKSNLQTMTYAHGDSSNLETTGLAVLAMLKWGKNPTLTNKVLTYLIRSKDPQGTWHTTQATILALKSLLLASTSATPTNATVTVSLDGREVQKFNVTPEDSDVVRLADLGSVFGGEHKVTLDFAGEGNVLYQIVGRYYMDWNERPRPLDGLPVPDESLDIRVSYDKTRLSKDDVITATCVVENKRGAAAKMVIVDLGIPPGFTASGADFEKLVAEKVITKFQMTGRQVILYFEEIQAHKPVSFTYELRAKYPIRAKTRMSKAYEYYNPEGVAIAAPVEIEVTE